MARDFSHLLCLLILCETRYVVATCRRPPSRYLCRITSCYAVACGCIVSCCVSLCVVKSLAATEDCLWVGMEDGRIHVLRLSDGFLVKTLSRVHSGPVMTLLPVAGQVGRG